LLNQQLSQVSSAAMLDRFIVDDINRISPICDLPISVYLPLDVGPGQFGLLFGFGGRRLDLLLGGKLSLCLGGSVFWRVGEGDASDQQE